MRPHFFVTAVSVRISISKSLMTSFFLLKESHVYSLPQNGVPPEVKSALDRLKRSDFRSRFSLTPEECAYVNNRGLSCINAHARRFITDRLSASFPLNDRKQTPMKGHPVFKAQHATATCCRSCLEKWHGIKKGRNLSDRQISFIVELIMAWIRIRAVDQTKGGQLRLF